MSNNSAAEPLEALKGDINTLRTDLSNILSDIAGLRTEVQKQAKAQLGDSLDSATDKLSGLKDHLTEATSGQVVAARKSVQRNPLSALALAFGFGLVLSRILR